MVALAVSRSAFTSHRRAWIVLGLAFATLGRTSTANEPVVRVRSALERGSFPWYDPRADDVLWKRVDRPPQDSSNPSRAAATGTGWAWGDYLVFGCALTALVNLTGLVVRSWRRYEPPIDPLTVSPRTSSVARGSEALPPGLSSQAMDDPWSEANRRRLAGDYAGAVVILFAHQLLSLSRRGLVRLAPGRTGRQLLRSISDHEFQTLLTPTLRQFEAVYYGHRGLSATDFDAVWVAAEAFERRLAERGVR